MNNIAVPLNFQILLALAEMDGATRLVDGSADPAARYEYGRLEIFARGFWSNVCNNDRFTPDAAQVACRALGYDGGAALRFTQPYVNLRQRLTGFSQVSVHALFELHTAKHSHSVAACGVSDGRQAMRHY